METACVHGDQAIVKRELEQFCLWCVDLRVKEETQRSLSRRHEWWVESMMDYASLSGFLHGTTVIPFDQERAA